MWASSEDRHSASYSPLPVTPSFLRNAATALDRSELALSYAISSRCFSSQFECAMMYSTMPTRSSKPKDHDFATVAPRVVEQAIGEHLDEAPLKDRVAGKNPAAVALGKLGGAKGGAARAAALSPAKRKAIAKKAARARWRARQVPASKA
jgi:hypothetical protein